MTAESAHHLADAISEETGKNRDEIFGVISESLLHHLQHPPDDLVGEHVEKT